MNRIAAADMVGQQYRKNRRMRLRWMLLSILLIAQPAVARAQPITVFAAASLTDALNSIGAQWQKAGNELPRFSFAASSTLARQIAEGAPANIFASADEKWMDYLAQQHLLAPNTRTDLLTNELVLVVPANGPDHVSLKPSFGLARLLGPGGRLAVGDPNSVPAGIYAEQALKKLGVWNYARDHLAPAQDVRGALLLVERGEAPAGIVYATDAAVARNVKVAAVFPPDSHDPITYPFALIKTGDAKQARAFFNYLKSPTARSIFERFGFGVENENQLAHQ